MPIAVKQVKKKNWRICLCFALKFALRIEALEKRAFKNWKLEVHNGSKCLGKKRFKIHWEIGGALKLAIHSLWSKSVDGFVLNVRVPLPSLCSAQVAKISTWQKIVKANHVMTLSSAIGDKKFYKLDNLLYRKAGDKREKRCLSDQGVNVCLAGEMSCIFIHQHVSVLSRITLACFGHLLIC